MENVITSVQNPRVKAAIALRERRKRNACGQFLIEGYREILRSLNGPYPLETFFYCRSLFLGSNEQALLEKSGAQLIETDERVFRKLSYRDRPDGLLAVATQKHFSLNHLQLSKAPFLVIAEAIEKPGNLGTILRSTDAVGADGLIVVDPCTDIFNPNVVRASVGTLFTVPVIQASSEETLAWLQEKKIQVLAATPAAQNLFTDVDSTGPVAICVGTEQLGLSKLWMDNADLQVRIPMLGQSDSLNVATATTLLLYEVVRQRS